MAARSIRVYPETPHHKTVKETVEILKRDGVVIYPTDTIYGLGADLYSKKALEKILHIKKANHHKPLSFILHDLKEIAHYALVPDAAYKIMRRVTPGPYTFILKATKNTPRYLLHKQKTVGIRIPRAPLALAIVQELGHPILSSSVPGSDVEYHSDPDAISAEYGHMVDLILDGGMTYNNPSTIVDFTGDYPEIIREGAGSIEELNF
ncbi:MAG: threonylcarbamoyl-AMP synthase [Calditrichaeota bacterium]|nr:MAG: threonylcarbamoyl-AMP synthase [Calditrichota bacterium]